MANAELAIEAQKAVGYLLEEVDILYEREDFSTFRLAYALAAFSMGVAGLGFPRMPPIVFAFLLYGYHVSTFGVFKYGAFVKEMNKFFGIEMLTDATVKRWLSQSGLVERVRDGEYKFSPLGIEMMGKVETSLNATFERLNMLRVKRAGTMKSMVNGKVR